MKARWIAFAYFAVLFLFACVYYWMPDADFYHQSIQFEPTSVEHKNRLLISMNKTFKIQSATGPYGTAVSSNSVSELTFPETSMVQFSVGYYYYNLQAKAEDWPALLSHCGPSEEKQPSYFTKYQLPHEHERFFNRQNDDGSRRNTRSERMRYHRSAITL